jgi:Tol biopolymer transport system component
MGCRSAGGVRHQARGATVFALIITIGVACTQGSESRTQASSLSSATHTATPTPRPHPLGLAVVGLDGRVRRDLPLPEDAWMADLTGDGSRVAFLTFSTKVGFCGGCTHHDRLVVMGSGASSGNFVYPAHGGSFRRIEEPRWSPTGDRIAFVGVRARGERDIFVADLTSSRGAAPAGLIGAKVRRLTEDPALDEFPAWSADGSTIFYDNAGREPVDDSGFSPTQEIWSVPASGGAPRRLTHDGTPDVQPDVAPDGTVAYWHGGEIWVMDPSGSNQRRLEAVRDGLWFNPRWSPDGSKLALLRFADGRATMPPRPGVPDDLPLLEVVVVDLATGKVTQVGPRVASDVNPVSWTPDGSALLIDRFDDGV